MYRSIAILAAVAVTTGSIAGCATPGSIAMEQGDSVQLQRILSEPNHGGENMTPLLDNSVIEQNCVECARVLLQAGAKAGFSHIPEGAPSLDFLLYFAIRAGHMKMAQVLIDHGAELSGAVAFGRQYGELPPIAKDAFKNSDAVSVPASSDDSATGGHSQLVPLFRQAEHLSDYALIIGVEKYDGLPAATYAKDDAATAADFVRAMGVPARNVVTLTDSHATRSAMVKQLENWLAKNTDDTSTVYFYFSGHGAPDPATGQAYLVPFDGDPQYLAETAYPLKRLYEKLGALKSKRTIVMIDSCFSGAGGRSVLAKGTRPLVSNIDTGVSSAGGNIAVLTASGANQISGTNDEKGHGLFTYYLFNGLNGAAQDSSGRVTLQSLYNYLKPKVMDDARRANGDQTPQLRANEAADVVLRAK